MIKDDVALKLIRYIADNDLPAGTKLPSIRELSSLWKCNPSRVRTALIILSALGIVETHSRAGSFVKKLDPGGMNTLFSLFFRLGMLSNAAETIHLYEVKVLLDKEVFFNAVTYRTERDLIELKAILRKQEDSLDNGPAFVDRDEEFHLRLAKIVRNPVVFVLLESIQSMLRPYRYANFDGRVCRDAYADHLRIYEAIRSQDGAKAEEAAKIHSRQRMEQLLEKRETKEEQLRDVP